MKDYAKINDKILTKGKGLVVAVDSEKAAITFENKTLQHIIDFFIRNHKLMRMHKEWALSIQLLNPVYQGQLVCINGKWFFNMDNQ